MLAHFLAGPLHDAHDAGFAHEHVVGLLGQHEAAGAGERVEARFRKRAELELAVAVLEEGVHEEGEPIVGGLVERLQRARLVGIARVAGQQLLRLLAPVAAKEGVQQVDHRPEVAAFLDIDLVEVAQVVERGRGEPQAALLLDRRGLGIALDDDEAAQLRPVLARQLLPRGRALVDAEAHAPVGLGLGQEDAPAVVRHLDVIEVRPAVAESTPMAVRR